MTTKIIVGDALSELRLLPSESVHCCVSSPPYWGLRRYLDDAHPEKRFEIGLEPTIGEYIAKMVEVFAEVRRVLRDDGTAWVNMGDSYATGTTSDRKPTATGKHGYWENPAINKRVDARDVGLKPKDLCGIPWCLAFALQADGWWLRQDIVWAKPNPMPESVTDRCTKAHEYIFLLSKSERYWFDADAIAEPAGATNAHDYTGGGYLSTPPGQRPQNGNRKSKMPDGWDRGPGAHGTVHRDGREKGRPVELAKGFRGGSYVGGEPGPRTETGNTYAPEGFKRNKRSVWMVATAPFKDAHFATFPPALIEPCILAGCPIGGTVLDPFFGAGTTGLVADRLQRNCIGIELNPAYAQMARNRIHNDAPLFAEAAD